jgi:hypothetical protein
MFHSTTKALIHKAIHMKDSYFIHAILHIYHTDNHHVAYERYSEALSFICISLYFSELKDMYKTLSFIYNYTENVFVTYKMKHFGHFPENNMYICISMWNWTGRYTYESPIHLNPKFQFCIDYSMVQNFFCVPRDSSSHGIKIFSRTTR